MTRFADAWLPLVVDEGQSARTTGTVLQVCDVHVLVPRGGTVRTSQGEPVGASPVVPLESPSPSVDLVSIEGRDASLTGRLTGGRLSVDRAQVLASQPDIRYVDVDATFQSQRRGELAVRPDVERELIDAGVLVDLWPDSADPGRYVALATDVELVRSALSPHYGDRLTVVRSKWTETMLSEIERKLTADGLAQSFGRGIGPDGQMYVTATLLHISSSVVRRIESFPPETMDIQSLLLPLSE